MDAVAQRAGVSKQTVYSHFASKEDLFRACIRGKVAGYGFAETAIASAVERDLREALLALTHRVLDLLTDPEVVAMHRVVMAEAVNHPRIAELFYESGPSRTRSAVGAFLSEQAALGRLRLPADLIPYAAMQLLAAAFGKFQLELWLGLRERVSEEDLERHAEHVVDDFLRLYAEGGAA
jgi:TetR/AcrR family transcriptional repressor of mexJK operon